MYEPGFRRKKNNLPILSREDIDYYAERLVADFAPELVERPGELDIDRFLTKHLGLNLDFHRLSHNGVFLGMLVFGDTSRLPVFDPQVGQAKYVSVSANTVIIDESLLLAEAEQRYRFTGAHEAGHGVFHKDFYCFDKNQLSFFDQSEDVPIVKCRSATVQSSDGNAKGLLLTDNDWMEWQANYFASALLMPKSMVKALAEEADADIFIRDFYLVKSVAETFNVSRTAAEHRLTSLGLMTPYRIHIGEKHNQEAII